MHSQYWPLLGLPYSARKDTSELPDYVMWQQKCKKKKKNVPETCLQSSVLLILYKFRRTKTKVIMKKKHHYFSGYCYMKHIESL